MPNATDKYLYALVRTWIGLLVTNLNASLTAKAITNLSRITSTMDVDNLSSMDSDYKYFIKFTDTGIEDTEAENELIIDVNIEFEFALNNIDSTKYESVIDNILYPLYYLLNNHNSVNPLPYSSATVSTVLKIIRIYERKIEDMNKIEDGYYKPKISFKLNITDFSV